MKPINNELNNNIFIFIRSPIATLLDSSLGIKIIDIPKAEISNNASVMITSLL